MNVFIDFDIIKQSNPQKLKEEFETIIMRKNNIFIWHKNIDPARMREYCLGIKFDTPEEKETHNKIIQLRKEKKTYKEISEQTNTPIWKLSFYLSLKAEKIWTLDDWIKNYLKKDSSIYQKVDFVIDPVEKFVNRFKLKGIDGNCIEKII